MRVSVVASVVLHGAVFALAARLPERPPARAALPIEVEVRRPLTPPPTPAPPEPAPPPRPIVPETKVAMRNIIRERERLPDKKRDEELQPEKAPEPERVPSGGPQVPSDRPVRPLDLTLHALPGASGGGVVLPPGVGSGMGSGPPGNGRREWRPRGDAGDPITGKVKETPKDEFPLDRVGRDEYVYKGGQFSAHIAPDGSVSFDDKSIRDFNGTSGSFDVTDMLMRRKGEDPYRHVKKKFMAATETLRTELAKRARMELIEGSLAQLSLRCERIWRDGRYSAAERRKLLFVLWKETVSDDGDLSDAGESARRIIEGFIRERLPQGSAQAFTPEELAACNRSSKVPFAPYPN